VVGGEGVRKTPRDNSTDLRLPQIVEPSDPDLRVYLTQPSLKVPLTMSVPSTAADPMTMIRPLLWVVLGSFALGAIGAVAFKSTQNDQAERTRSAETYAPRAMNQPLRNPLSALP
jgi:hypothetical protein